MLHVIRSRTRPSFLHTSTPTPESFIVFVQLVVTRCPTADLQVRDRRRLHTTGRRHRVESTRTPGGSVTPAASHDWSRWPYRSGPWCGGGFVSRILQVLVEERDQVCCWLGLWLSSSACDHGHVARNKSVVLALPTPANPSPQRLPIPPQRTFTRLPVADGGGIACEHVKKRDFTCPCRRQMDCL